MSAISHATDHPPCFTDNAIWFYNSAIFGAISAVGFAVFGFPTAAAVVAVTSAFTLLAGLLDSPNPSLALIEYGAIAGFFGYIVSVYFESLN